MIGRPGKFPLEKVIVREMTSVSVPETANYLNHMKHLRLVLPSLLVAFIATLSIAAADSYDSEMATIQKGSGSKAKVMVDKDTYMAPISFSDGADWTTVKDHYEVDPSVVSGLKAKKIAIAIGSDGTASFTKMKK
jgi:hypothetical protein